MAAGVGPITNVVTDIDKIIAGVVEKVWHALSQDNAVVISTMVLLVIMWIGFEAMSGSKTITVSTAAKKIVIAFIAYIFMTDWSAFHYVFVRIPVEFPDSVINSLTKAITGKEVAVYGALDKLAMDIVGLTDFMFQQVSITSFTGIGYLFWAIIYTLMGTVVICVIVGLMSAFKVILAIVLMLAIIPLGCLMFRSTRGVFFNYVETIVGFAFMPVLIVAAAVFMLGIIGSYTHDLITGVVEINTRQLTLTLWVLGISIVVFHLLIKTLPRIGAGLFR